MDNYIILAVEIDGSFQMSGVFRGFNSAYHISWLHQFFLYIISLDILNRRIVTEIKNLFLFISIYWLIIKSNNWKISKSLYSNCRINLNFEIHDIKDLLSSHEKDITFLHSKKYKDVAKKTKASFCITNEVLKKELPQRCIPIVVENVLVSTSKITSVFYPDSINDDFDDTVIPIEHIKFDSKVKFGKKIVENFWDLKLIRLPQDIFNLDYSKIKNFEGWGIQSASNLKYSIDQRKNISLDRFIYALGIRHIGLENAKLIARHIKSIKNFLEFPKNNNYNELLNIDGIGETQIKSIKNFFNNNTNLNVLNELNKILSVKDSINLKKNGLLKNKTFMLTGKLDRMSRAEAKSLIEQNSGSIISNVSKKLDYLIVGEKPTKRKIEHAKELGIEILSQDQWLKLLNKRI